MADGSKQNPSKSLLNQPYDESLEVPDAEEVASIYTPTPRVPGFGRGGDQYRGNNSPDLRMKEPDVSDDEIERPKAKIGQTTGYNKEIDADDSDSTGEETDDDDDDDGSNEAIDGAYDPKDYDHLEVSEDIRGLFQYITRYTPQTVELEHQLKPFIPDYIPAVGDIDAFIKVPRPDGHNDKLGLQILDEPCAKQSDPIVLEMHIRSKSKQTHSKSMAIKSIPSRDINAKSINNWCQNIADIHRTRPPPTVHYTRNMPSIDALMQEWPPEFEELLKEITLPSADMDCDLPNYIDMICAILDIPMYKNRVQSLHLLFTLYSEFKNSQHFRGLAADNKLDNALKDNEERLVL
ncbi:DgyrCDS7535 [Dimorphilus gyrociliatus]|uniref:Intraflagellar transport protein 46 homolog n=1 Tax=Dimorphilus gyrociliatus TaxID=2664684 RepID=A0A7I8VRH4_9ANNE|nr:DgyrCDS7535 [Dimorphilus gyrociliatus]